MDQISGFLPQIGWSPLQMPATPKKPPASTVEPAAKSANANGGLSAQVDTQTPHDHAQAARLIETMAAASARESDANGSAENKAPIDPEGPTGPPPTFDVTPLEAEAVRRMSVPKTVAELKDQIELDSVQALPAPDDAAPSKEKTEATQHLAKGEATGADAAKRDTEPNPAPVSASKSGTVWKSIGAPEPHQMDLTR